MLDFEYTAQRTMWAKSGVRLKVATKFFTGRFSAGNPSGIFTSAMLRSSATPHVYHRNASRTLLAHTASQSPRSVGAADCIFEFFCDSLMSSVFESVCAMNNSIRSAALSLRVTDQQYLPAASQCFLSCSVF